MPQGHVTRLCQSVVQGFSSVLKKSKGKYGHHADDNDANDYDELISNGQGRKSPFELIFNVLKDLFYFFKKGAKIIVCRHLLLFLKLSDLVANSIILAI